MSLAIYGYSDNGQLKEKSVEDKQEQPITVVGLDDTKITFIGQLIVKDNFENFACILYCYLVELRCSAQSQRTHSHELLHSYLHKINSQYPESLLILLNSQRRISYYSIQSQAYPVHNSMHSIPIVQNLFCKQNTF